MLLLLLACPQTPDTPDETAEETASPIDWPSEGTVLDHLTLVDGNGARADKALVLVGDTIWAVTDAGQAWPEQLTVQDTGGAYALPGLIDSHVHLAYTGALIDQGDLINENVDATLAWGVVGVVDVGGPVWTYALRDSLNATSLHVKATGPFLTAEGSHPCELTYDRQLCVFIEDAAPAQDLVDQGADGLKVALADAGIDATWPRLDPDLIEDVAALGAPVFVHVGSAQDATDAGAVHLTHTPFDSAMSAVGPLESVHSTIGANGSILWTDDIPDTVPAAVAATWNGSAYPVWMGAAEAWTVIARQNLAFLVQNEAPVVAGSDAGYYFVPHGYALHRELQELVNAGMSPQQAIAAATSIPAERYGFEDLGCLDEGCEASLVLLNANPLDDIANTTSIREVWLRGQPAQPSDVGTEAFCMDDGDCSTGRCDRVLHVCEDACTAWSADNSCGEDSWCAATDTNGLGVCHAEVAPCDWKAQDCLPLYGETCIPADLDTNYCWPSGPAQLLDSCSYDNPNTRCEQGLYCSPVSFVCLEYCQVDQDCSWGSCQWQQAAGEDWFGLCY